MTYLITQIFILLLIAGLLGLILGWYLTRLAANSARSSLQLRLNSAEADARQLRGEVDAAVNARGHAEAELKKLGDRVAELEGGMLPGDAGDSAARAALQDELDACREQLAAAATPATGASPGAAPASQPIAKVSAAAAEAAAAMGGDAGAVDDVAAPPADDGSVAPDDLQQIRGIGPKIAGILDGLGIRRFEQIASWSPENVAWVNDQLRFKGRIEREEWIPQARALIAARDD
ncbi:MAG: hypothetical protein QNJ91_04510 [Gammaproteobacteria bacterium]|nr:hypothetical protein [Gammaproteobacteria bacterium]